MSPVGLPAPRTPSPVKRPTTAALTDLGNASLPRECAKRKLFEEPVGESNTDDVPRPPTPKRSISWSAGPQTKFSRGMGLSRLPRGELSAKVMLSNQTTISQSRLVIYCLIYWLIVLLVSHSWTRFIVRFIDSLIRWSVNCSVFRLLDWLIGWFFGCSVEWLLDWLIEWKLISGFCAVFFYFFGGTNFFILMLFIFFVVILRLPLHPPYRLARLSRPTDFQSSQRATAPLSNLCPRLRPNSMWLTATAMTRWLFSPVLPLHANRRRGSEHCRLSSLPHRLRRWRRKRTRLLIWAVKSPFPSRNRSPCHTVNYPWLFLYFHIPFFRVAHLLAIIFSPAAFVILQHDWPNGV